MTDRINTLTVVLEKPTRDDDCANLVQAIEAMRGVQSVKLGEVFGDCLGARTQEAERWRKAIFHLLRVGPNAAGPIEGPADE